MRFPFSSPRKRSPDFGSTARLPRTVFRGPSANGITTLGAREASMGIAARGSSQKISAAASPRQPWLKTARRPDAVNATINAPLFITGATVSLEPGGETGRQQFRVPTYIYVIEGVLTTDYEAGPVGIKGVQYHAGGQSFMDNGGWWHNHTNKTDKTVKYLMLHVGYPGRPDPVQRPDAE